MLYLCSRSHFWKAMFFDLRIFIRLVVKIYAVVMLVIWQHFGDNLLYLDTVGLNYSRKIYKLSDVFMGREG